MAVVESVSVFGVEALQPASPPLDIPYRGDDTGIAQVGLDPNEIELTMQLDAESFVRLYPPLEYCELDLANSVVDTLYRETREPVYKTPVLIPIYVTLKPLKAMLKRFGIEDEHDALCMISLGWLHKNHPEIRVKTGDRIGYYDKAYVETSLQPHGLPDQVLGRETVAHDPNMQFELLTVCYGDFWGNSQRPLHLVGTLKNLRAPGKPDTNVNPR